MFDESWVPSDIEMAGYSVNFGLSDGAIGEIMGTWDVASAGRGGVFYIPTRGFGAWVPEGWRMAGEVAPDDGKPQPTFYRDGMARGAVRVTAYWRKTNETRDLRAEALAESERRRKIPGIDNVSVEERRLIVVSWSQVVKEPNQVNQTRIYAWLVHDPQGQLLTTFASSVSNAPGELADELSSIREIAGRISRI